MRITAASAAALSSTTTATAWAPAAVARPAEIPWTTRSASFTSGASFVDFQIPAVHFFAVEPGNGLGCFIVIGHLDEAKASRPARLAVRRDVDPRNLAEWLEESAQFAFGRLETHVAHKKILHLFLSRCTSTAVEFKRTRFRRSSSVAYAFESAEVSGGNAQSPCLEFRQSYR